MPLEYEAFRAPLAFQHLFRKPESQAIRANRLETEVEFALAQGVARMAMVFPPMLFVQVRADRGWNTRVDSGP